MNKEIKAVYDIVKAKGAPGKLLSYLEQLPEDISWSEVFYSTDFLKRGYFSWCDAKLGVHMHIDMHPKVTSAQYERGLQDENFCVREAWINKTTTN